MIADGANEGVEDSVSTTETIIEAVAAVSGRDPFELPPLWNVIDPEALDALFEPTKAGLKRSGRVEFTYCDFLITVDDGDVTVSPVADANADDS